MRSTGLNTLTCWQATDSIDSRFCSRMKWMVTCVQPTLFCRYLAGFPDVKVAGLSKEQQQRNVSDLHRLIRMAHDRGIKVTLGFWCHFYQTSTSYRAASQKQPETGKVVGLTLDNLIPYTRNALATMLRAFPEVDMVQFLMNPESGLRSARCEEFLDECLRWNERSCA